MNRRALLTLGMLAPLAPKALLAAPRPLQIVSKIGTGSYRVTLAGLSGWLSDEGWDFAGIDRAVEPFDWASACARTHSIDLRTAMIEAWDRAFAEAGFLTKEI